MAQKKAVELSKHETDVLLGLYSGCECLWNTKSADYNVRAIRHGAFRTIINGMRLETGKVFTIDEVLGSLRSVKSVYQRELQQVLDGEKNPSTSRYKPQWRWFHFLDSFLRNHVLQKDADPDICGYDDSNSKQVIAESSETDENDCAIIDSEDEGSVAPVIRARVQSRNHSNKPQASAVTNYLRSVKNRGLKLSTSSVANGVHHRGDRQTAERQSPRKKQKMTLVSSQDNLKTVTSPVGRTANSSMRRANANTSSSTKVDNRQAQCDNNQPSSHSADSLHISSQIAETLKAVQTLLAKSLTDQDQPSMVFARHIAKELELITNYPQRKQCMLDIQQVIMGYQTGQREAVNVKHEKISLDIDEEEVTRVQYGCSSASSNTTAMQCGEESLPLHFDASTC